MRRITLKIAVAFLAFVIGIAFTTFWFIFSQPLSQVLEVSTDAVVTEESEEYAVYSAAIHHLLVKNRDSVRLLAIFNQTSFYGDNFHKAVYGDYIKNTTPEQRVKEMNEWHPSVSDETLFDYDEKKMQSHKLQRNFNLSVRYILFDEDDFARDEKQGKASVIYEKYNADKIIRLSKVGFNKERNQALLYIEFSGGGMCSGSDHLLLEKVDGNWKIERTFMGFRS